jgi:DNA polymerase-3 subunit delta'
MPFSDFIGNRRIVDQIQRMLGEGRLPQTLLFAGPSGVGKATLVRYLAAAMICKKVEADFCGQCPDCTKILSLDLSTDQHRREAEDRAKLPAAKRTENPLILSTHPDFLLFPPDGPLRMISIEQARQLRKAAQYVASTKAGRLFHLDHADRANDEASNALLKTLEEPSPNLTIVLTAENAYQLLPTIRSRSVPFHFSPLTNEEMQPFVESREDLSPEERKALSGWAQGSPGRALSLDVESHLARREHLLSLLDTALGKTPFAELLAHTDAIGRRQSEKIGLLVEILHSLLSDLLHLRLGSGRLANVDIRERLRELADRVEFEWIEQAARDLDNLARLERRNIQRQIAVEALAINWRRRTAAARNATRAS